MEGDQCSYQIGIEMIGVLVIVVSNLLPCCKHIPMIGVLVSLEGSLYYD